jgi:predicted DNA-binding transcriptional regulator AlpA
MEATMANTPAPPEACRAGSSFTIAEFCQHNGISISFFYKLAKQGKAPATMRIGKRRRMISADANAAWVASQESAAAA